MSKPPQPGRKRSRPRTIKAQSGGTSGRPAAQHSEPVAGRDRKLPPPWPPCQTSPVAPPATAASPGSTAAWSRGRAWEATPSPAAVPPGSGAAAAPSARSPKICLALACAALRTPSSASVSSCAVGRSEAEAAAAPRSWAACAGGAGDAVSVGWELQGQRSGSGNKAWSSASKSKNKDELVGCFVAPFPLQQPRSASSTAVVAQTSKSSKSKSCDDMHRAAMSGLWPASDSGGPLPFGFAASATI